MIAALIPSLLLVAAMSVQAETHTLSITVDDPSQWAGLQAVVAKRNAEITERNAALQPCPAGDTACVESVPAALIDEQTYMQSVIGAALESYAKQTGMDRITGMQAYLAIQGAGLVDQYQAWLVAPERTPEEKAIAGYAEWQWDSEILRKGAADLGLTEDQLWELFVLGRSR